MYDEIGIRSAVARAYQQLQKSGLDRAHEDISRHVPGISLEQQAIFPDTPLEIATSPNFTPMMRLVSQELQALFSGEVGRQTLLVLRAVAKTHRILGQSMHVDGRIEYGVDCFGPYRCLYPKRLPFRRKRAPAVTRVSFGELCFHAGDPKEVYRTTYQLLHVAAEYLLGAQKPDS